MRGEEGRCGAGGVGGECRVLGGDWPVVWDPPLFGAPCFIPTPDSAPLGLQEKEKLAMLERRYHSLTGGRPFPKTTPTLKEVTWLGQPQPPEPTGLLGGSGETGGTFAPGAEV